MRRACLIFGAENGKEVIPGVSVLERRMIFLTHRWNTSQPESQQDPRAPDS